MLALICFVALQFFPGDPSKLMVTIADSEVRILKGADVICRYKGAWPPAVNFFVINDCWGVCEKSASFFQFFFFSSNNLVNCTFY